MRLNAKKVGIVTGLCILLTIIYFLSNSFNTITGNAIYFQGNGSIENPYIITNCTQLQAINQNLTSHYILNNSINMSAQGCEQFQQGRGFEPIGNSSSVIKYINEITDSFQGGSLEGRGHSIYNLFINRTNESYIGLFSHMYESNISNLSIINSRIYGGNFTGCISGYTGSGNLKNISCKGILENNLEGAIGGITGVSMGTTLNKTYFNGSILSKKNNTYMGGISGITSFGSSIDNSSSEGYLNGLGIIGGLTGMLALGLTENSFSKANISTNQIAGGIIGIGLLSGILNSHYIGNNIQGETKGGLIGMVTYTVINNSFYNYNLSLLNGEKRITLGALYEEQFNEWLTNNKYLNISKYLSKNGEQYLINNVSDLKQLLAFGQDNSSNFKLMQNINLINESNFYIPYFSGKFDGNGKTMGNLSINLSSFSNIALFGILWGNLTNLGLENISIKGNNNLGAFCSENLGEISNVYSTGKIQGNDSIGGICGNNYEMIINAYSLVNITGINKTGGIVGVDSYGLLNTFYNNETSIGLTNTYGTSKTTSQMKSSQTYNGWNFINIWGMQENSSYPYLGNPGILDNLPAEIISNSYIRDSNSAYIIFNTSKLTNASLKWGENLNLSNISISPEYLSEQEIYLSNLTSSKTYYYNLTVCTMSGNCTSIGPLNFTTLTYTQSPGTPSGTTPTGSTVFRPTEAQVEQGFTRTLNIGDQIEFRILNETHLITLENYTNMTSTINISSDPQTITLNLGENLDVDLNADQINDLNVRLESIIVNSGARITIYKINETQNVAGTSQDLPPQDLISPSGDQQTSTPLVEEDEDNRILYYVIFGTLGILILAMIITIVAINLNTNNKKVIKVINPPLNVIQKQNEPQIKSPLSPLQTNPLIIKVRSLLDESLTTLDSGNRELAIEKYNQAKRIFETNKLSDPDTVNKFYTISTALDGFK